MNALPATLELERLQPSRRAKALSHRLPATLLAFGGMAVIATGIVAARVLLYALAHRDALMWADLLRQVGL